MEQYQTWMREQIGKAYHVDGQIESAWPDADVIYTVPANHHRHTYSIESKEEINRYKRKDDGFIRPKAVFNRHFFQVKGRESRRSKSKLPSINLYGINVSLVRLITELPVLQSLWVRYAYTTEYQWDHEQSLVKHIWQDFIQSLPENITTEKLQKLKGLCYLSVQDAKQRFNRGKVQHKPSQIRKLLDIPGRKQLATRLVTSLAAASGDYQRC